MKKPKKYSTVGSVLKSNRIIVERSKVDAPNTQIHDGDPGGSVS